MKVLIIGANGFLGSKIVLYGIGLKWKITAVINKNSDNIPGEERFIKITDIQKLKRNEYDLIFISAGSFQDDLDNLTLTNIKIPYYITSRSIASERGCQE